MTWQPTQVMGMDHNNLYLEVDEEGNRIRFTIDLNRNLGMSASGKNVVIASTPGKIKFGRVDLNVQCYRPPFTINEFTLKDHFIAPVKYGKEMLEAAGEKLSDWAISQIKLDNGLVVDAMSRKRALRNVEAGKINPKVKKGDE